MEDFEIRETSDKDIKKENRKKRMIKVVIILTIVLLFVLVAIYFLESDKSLVGFDMTDTYEHQGYEDEYYFIKEGSLYSYKGDKLKYSFDVDEDSNIEVDKDYLYIANSNIVNIHDKKNGELLSSLDMVNRIYNLDFSNGEKKVYVNNSIGILGPENEIIEEYKLEGIPLSYDKGMYSNIISVNEDYEFNFLIYDQDNLIYSLKTKEKIFFNEYIDEKNSILASNQALYLFQGDKLAQRVSIKDINGLDIFEEKIALVDENSLKIYDKELNLLDSRDMDDNIKKLIYNDNNIFLLGEDISYIYKTNLDEGIKEIECLDIFEDNEEIYIIKENGIERFEE